MQDIDCLQNLFSLLVFYCDCGSGDAKLPCKALTAKDPSTKTSTMTTSNGDTKMSSKREKLGFRRVRRQEWSHILKPPFETKEFQTLQILTQADYLRIVEFNFSTFAINVASIMKLSSSEHSLLQDLLTQLDTVLTADNSPIASSSLTLSKNSIDLIQKIILFFFPNTSSYSTSVSLSSSSSKTLNAVLDFLSALLLQPNTRKALALKWAESSYDILSAILAETRNHMTPGSLTRFLTFAINLTSSDDIINFSSKALPQVFGLLDSDNVKMYQESQKRRENRLSLLNNLVLLWKNTKEQSENESIIKLLRQFTMILKEETEDALLREALFILLFFLVEGQHTTPNPVKTFLTMDGKGIVEPLLSYKKDEVIHLLAQNIFLLLKNYSN